MLVTIGHSNHTLAAFLELLEAQRVALVADIRRIPRSSRHPHFSGPALDAALAQAGIAYRHFEALGGMRIPLAGPSCIGGAWREPAFRGYADHMATLQFRAALDELLALAAAEQTVAALCAEADPLSCHRQLLADAVLARGLDVVHLLPGGAFRYHELTPHARVHPLTQTVTYPSLLDGGGDAAE